MSCMMEMEPSRERSMPSRSMKIRGVLVASTMLSTRLATPPQVSIMLADILSMKLGFLSSKLRRSAVLERATRDAFIASKSGTMTDYFENIAHLPKLPITRIPDLIIGPVLESVNHYRKCHIPTVYHFRYCRDLLQIVVGVSMRSRSNFAIHGGEIWQGLCSSSSPDSASSALGTMSHVQGLEVHSTLGKDLSFSLFMDGTPPGLSH